MLDYEPQAQAGAAGAQLLQAGAGAAQHGVAAQHGFGAAQQR